MQVLGQRLSSPSASCGLGEPGTEGHRGGHIPLSLWQLPTWVIQSPLKPFSSFPSKDSKLWSSQLSRHIVRIDAPAGSELGRIGSVPRDWLWSHFCSITVAGHPESQIRTKHVYQLSPPFLPLTISAWRKAWRILFWICNFERSQLYNLSVTVEIKTWELLSFKTHCIFQEVFFPSHPYNSILSALNVSKTMF